MTVTRHDTQEIRLLAMLLMKIPRQVLEQRFSDENIDLTMLQHHIMMLASRHQPTLADMSRTFGLDPSTLVPTVDALVKKGYLRRERDPQDRRRYPLYLTEEGQVLHHRICNHFGDDPLQVALNGIPQQDVEQLRDVLQRIVERLPDGKTALTEIYNHMQAYDLADDDNH